MKTIFWIIGLAFCSIGCSGSDENGKPGGGATPPDGPGATDGGGTTKPGTDPGCGLNTGYEGDEFCILPPPEGQGFQLHYGPSNYTDQAEVARFLIQPGLDTNIYEPVVSGNTTDIFFYKRQYRMRRGSHHLIVSARGAGSILGTGRRLGGSQNTVKDNPTGELPPENVGIGMPLTANSELSLNLHHFNPGTTPLLKEAWVNFWYVDASKVTQEAKEIFLWAQGGTLQPGARATVRGKKTIAAPGRILTLYGHRHSNNVRFSAYRTRAGNRELVLDDYEWEEPAVLEFNSLTQNPGPNTTAKTAGGHSGVLDLAVGDVLEWECDVVNNRSVPITFGENEGATSEMCILVGDAVGPGLTGISEF